MNYVKIITGGIAATAVMTLFMLGAPYMMLPGNDIGTLLGSLFGQSSAAGWALHFAIGIFFAYLYALALNEWIPVVNDYARGMLYGIIVFVFSEIVLTVVNLSGVFSEDMKLLMAKTMFTNLFAHFIYGLVLGGYIGQLKLETFGWEQKEYFWRFRKHRPQRAH